MLNKVEEQLHKILQNKQLMTLRMSYLTTLTRVIRQSVGDLDNSAVIDVNNM